MRVYLLCAVFFLTAFLAAAPARAQEPAPNEGESAQAEATPVADADTVGDNGAMAVGDAVVVQAGEAGDWIEADSGSYLTGDKLELKGNVILHTESAFAGVVIEIFADLAIWEQKTGLFTVPGTTKITVSNYKLELEGTNLIANLTAHTGSLDAVKGKMRLDQKLLADENGMVNRQYIRFTTADPMASLISEGASLEEDKDGRLLFIFKRARIAPTDAATSDFRLKVQEMVYAPGEFVAVHNARVQASGVTVGYVPTFRFKLRKSEKILHGTVPLPGYDADDGFFLQQAEFLDYGGLQVDMFSEYYTEDNRFLADVYAYTKPTDSSRLGVHFGRDRTRDLYRKRVSRKTYFDFYYSRDDVVDWPLVRHLSFGANYAKRGQDVPKVTSRSLSGYAEARTKAWDLGGGVKAMGGFGARYWNYSYGDSDFLALQSFVRIARESPWGIDYVQFEHADKFGGSPFRFDDEFTENKLTANKNFQLLPHYTGRVTAAYNYDLNHFDNLTVGLSRELRMYYIGMNYNFARAAAGIEFALKF